MKGRIAPENPEGFEMLGLCYSKMGRNDEGYQAYKQALEADAARYVSLVGMGSIGLERGQLDEAMDFFTKAYKTSPNSAVLWNNIGIAMTEKKKFLVAYCCFKRALFLDPFRWNFHTNLALLFIKKCKYFKLNSDFYPQKSISRVPSNFTKIPCFSIFWASVLSS
jgi:tetratricopeptide (TPR) repeat protein